MSKRSSLMIQSMIIVLVLLMLFIGIITSEKSSRTPEPTVTESTVESSETESNGGLEAFCGLHHDVDGLCEVLSDLGVKEDLTDLVHLEEEDLTPHFPKLVARRVSLSMAETLGVSPKKKVLTEEIYTCGDGIVHEEEECDDGNVDDDDGCSATCLTEAEVDALNLVRLWYDTFRDKERQRPVFLVTLGPPGSGKTNIVTKLMQDRVWTLRNFAEIIQDNMLQKIRPYSKQMGALQAERKQYDEKAFMDASQAIYVRYRPIIKHMRTMLMDIALRERLNIVFETTGGGVSVDDTLAVMQGARDRGYYVEVVYPYVHTDVLHDRVVARNQKIVRTVPLDEVHAMEARALSNIVRFATVADALTVFDNNLPQEHPLVPLFKKSIVLDMLETEETDIPSENLADVVMRADNQFSYFCESILLQPLYRPLYSAVRPLCPSVQKTLLEVEMEAKKN